MAASRLHAPEVFTESKSVWRAAVLSLNEAISDSCAQPPKNKNENKTTTGLKLNTSRKRVIGVAFGFNLESGSDAECYTAYR